MKLQKRTVLITGGSSGIGLELAHRLLHMGNTVLVTGRDADRLARLRNAAPGLVTFCSDVSNPSAIEALYNTVVAAFPALDVLVNNAGVMRKFDLQDDTVDLADIGIEVNTNLLGPMRMVEQFLPHLKTRGQAAIVNVSSSLAFVPMAASPIYCATKAAIHSYSQSLRAQLKNTSIKVFELAPPGTKTPLMDSFKELDEKSLMSVLDLVSAAIKGLEADRFEIRPGVSNLLKWLSRIAPETALGIVSGRATLKPADLRS